MQSFISAGKASGVLQGIFLKSSSISFVIWCNENPYKSRTEKTAIPEKYLVKMAIVADLISKWKEQI